MKPLESGLTMDCGSQTIIYQTVHNKVALNKISPSCSSLSTVKKITPMKIKYVPDWFEQLSNK